MNQEEIRDLMREFCDSPLSMLEIEDGDTHIKMKKPAGEAGKQVAVNVQMPAMPMAGFAAPQASTPAPAASQEQAAAPAAEQRGLDNLIRVKAPLVGVYYEAPAPGEAPFVKVGDQVEKDQVICLIEAMKMINEIKAPKAGTIRWIAVENANTVGFGDILMEIEAV